TYSWAMESGVHLDRGPVEWPALVVHGGAGTYARLAEDPTLAATLESAMASAADAGWDVLVSGADPVAAVVAAVAYLEDHGGFNAGRGSVPNSAGGVEMDGAVMDESGRAGGVACITKHSAVRAADTLHRDGRALLLAGPHADAFAAAAGLPEMTHLRAVPLSEHGTVGAVAVSAQGRMAAATSTGGRPEQPPGRVGDSPIPGAGLWADGHASTVATGYGEAFVLAGFARLVAARSATRSGLEDALTAGLDAVAAYGGTGGGIALGRDRTWAAAHNTRAMARCVRHAGGRHVTVLDG
ncbi:MAG: isoaspartyl peptidase/L-asparaginase, partial [Acidimicrobiales bacterium]